MASTKLGGGANNYFNRSNTPISPIRKQIGGGTASNTFYQAILELPDEDMKSSIAITESNQNPFNQSKTPVTLTFDNRKIIFKDRQDLQE